MKLIIDTDPGVDDAMAIFYAALDPNIELLGLTSVFGNVTRDKATRNALRLAEMAGLDIPVAHGASQPSVLPPFKPSAHVHGEEGFGDIPAAEPMGKAIDESAAAFLCRMAREHKGELVVCPIGPITNIADAIKLDPAFATNVAKIVFMGGAAFAPGNITPYAEANTYHDPHALNVVLASGADITMVGLDVTDRISCSEGDFAMLEKKSPKLGGFLRQATDFYIDFYFSKTNVRACSLHDPAAVIACFYPHLFEMQETSILVSEEGETSGQTIPNSGDAGHVIKVCVGGDLDGVRNQFLSVFDHAH